MTQLVEVSVWIAMDEHGDYLLGNTCDEVWEQWTDHAPGVPCRLHAVRLMVPGGLADTTDLGEVAPNVVPIRQVR